MRTAWVGALVGALIGIPLTSPAHAVPPGMGGPVPVVADPVVVPAGTPTWVAVTWITTAPVCDFRLTARATDATVGYPSNTTPYSSFYRSAALLPGQSDYTSVRVDAAPGTRTVVVTLSPSYGYGTPRHCVDHAARGTVPVTLAVFPPF